MTDQQQRLADFLIDAQGALIELEGRLPGENEDVAGAFVGESDTGGE
jgi:hypothetical protein